jgi:ubiquinone/menaquinone biosynthesis C-methylase UbiE
MTVLEAAPDGGPVPQFDHGWVADGAAPTPFLAYAELDAEVNWSVELEALHEESSRTHFMDVMTRRAIIERLGRLAPAAAIADLGCSTGHLLADLRTAYPDATLYGVDLVRAGLVKAHELVPDSRLLCADVCRLPIGDGCIDAICSANLLEHVPDDRAALREMERVLKPGGVAAIVVPAGPSTYDYYDRFLGHERRYARRELARKAAAAGFDVLDDAYLGALIYPAFWLVKQRNRRRYGHLVGAALEQRVAHDIAGTNDSRLGHLTGVAERQLLARGIRLPFGIRNIVSLRRC